MNGMRCLRALLVPAIMMAMLIVPAAMTGVATAKAAPWHLAVVHLGITSSGQTINLDTGKTVKSGQRIRATTVGQRFHPRSGGLYARNSGYLKYCYAGVYFAAGCVTIDVEETFYFYYNWQYAYSDAQTGGASQQFYCSNSVNLPAHNPFFFCNDSWLISGNGERVTMTWVGITCANNICWQPGNTQVVGGANYNLDACHNYSCFGDNPSLLMQRIYGNADGSFTARNYTNTTH